MQYQVIFDSAAAPFPLQELAGLLGVVLICFFVFAWARFEPALGGWRGTMRTSRRLRVAFGSVFFGASLIAFFCVSAAAALDCIAIRGAVAEQRVSVVEGQVRNFREAERTGTDAFDVGDVHFELAPRVSWLTYHQTRSQGSPLRDALPARIAYVGPKSDARILRLEVAP